MRFGTVHRVAVAFAAVFFCACSPMRYAQYTGKEIWPTGPGTMAETEYAIPVYRGTPERPYDVIGSVRFQDPRKYWDDGIIRMAAKKGKEHGGDAVIIFRFGSPSSWLESFTARPTGYDSETRAYVIKWTADQVVKQRKTEQERFWSNVRSKYPNETIDEHVLQTAMSYLHASGVEANSADMESRLSDIVKEITRQEKTELAGRWLFRGVIQTRTLTTGDQPEPFFGLATIDLAGNRITILSSEGKVEVNFSGTVDGGQITGLLGLGARAASLPSSVRVSR